MSASLYVLLKVTPDLNKCQMRESTWEESHDHRMLYIWYCPKEMDYLECCIIEEYKYENALNMNINSPPPIKHAKGRISWNSWGRADYVISCRKEHLLGKTEFLKIKPPFQSTKIASVKVAVAGQKIQGLAQSSWNPLKMVGLSCWRVVFCRSLFW